MHPFNILLWATAVCPLALARPMQEDGDLASIVSTRMQRRDQTLTPEQLEALKNNPCANRPNNLCWCDNGFNDVEKMLCNDWNIPKCSACLKAMEDAGIHV